MAKSRDLELAEKIGEATARMLREHIAELRRQGRIKGKLHVIVKDGKRRIQLPYPET